MDRARPRHGRSVARASRTATPSLRKSPGNRFPRHRAILRRDLLRAHVTTWRGGDGSNVGCCRHWFWSAGCCSSASLLWRFGASTGIAPPMIRPAAQVDPSCSSSSRRRSPHWCLAGRGCSLQSHLRQLRQSRHGSPAADRCSRGIRGLPSGVAGRLCSQRVDSAPGGQGVPNEPVKRRHHFRLSNRIRLDSRDERRSSSARFPVIGDAT